MASQPQWLESDKGSTRPDEIFFKGLLDWQNKPKFNNPVLLVSLARRMGYPMKLMANTSYFMSRWETPNGDDNFYFDVSEGRYATIRDGKDGGSTLYFGSPQNPEKIEFKKLANTREEFAYFLYLRGIVLEERGYVEDSRVAYAAAQVFDPNEKIYQQAMLSGIDRQVKYYQLEWKEFEEVNAEYFRLKKPDPIKPQQLD